MSMTLSGLQASDVTSSIILQESLQYALSKTLGLDITQVSAPVVEAISNSLRGLGEPIAAADPAAAIRPQLHLSAGTFTGPSTDADAAPSLHADASSRRLVASCSVAMVVTSTLSSSAIQTSLGAAGAATTFVNSFINNAVAMQYSGSLSAVSVPGLTVAGSYLPAVASAALTHYVVEYFSSSDCSGTAYRVGYTRGSAVYIASRQTSACSSFTATNGSPGTTRSTKYATAPTLPLGFTLTAYSSSDAAALCAAGGDDTSVMPSGDFIEVSIYVADVCAPQYTYSETVPSLIYSCTALGYATAYYADTACASQVNKAPASLPYVGCSCSSATFCAAYSCPGAPPIPPDSSLTGGRNTDVTAAVVVVVVVVFGFAALAWAVHALHKIAWKLQTSTKLIEKFARKLYAISPLFFVIYNTIASIYGLGRGSTTKSMGNLLPPASFMGFYGYDYLDAKLGYLPIPGRSVPKSTIFWGHTCTEGVPSALSMTCSFANHPTFQYLVYIWAAFFVLFFLYRVAMLWSYSPDDLRFYIATQRLNGTKGNLVFLFVLFLLSVVTFLATIYSCILLQAGTSGYIQAAVFVVVNVLASMNLSTIEYKMHKETPYCCGLLKSRKLKSMDLFSKPCPITLPASERVWFNGVFVPHARVFNIIELAIAQAGVGDGSALRAIGDESVLVEYMTELTRVEKKEDNKGKQDKEGKEGKEDKAQVDEKGDAKGATTGGRVEGIKRISSLLPLVLLVLGIFNLIYGGININQVYKPPPTFLKQLMGYFSSDGSQQSVGDGTGATYLVPGNMQVTELQVCIDIFALQPVTTETLDTHIAASITCNVATSYYMIVLACLCLTFFAVWFGFRLSVTWNYAADDLRFLIATDRANCLYRNLVLCSVGAVLASVALLSIWFYRARVGDPPDTYFLDLVNVSVAIFSLLAYSRGRYSFGAAPTLKGGQESLEMEAFAQPCPLTLPNASLGNLYGGLVSHVKIFNMIELAISQAAQGEGAALAALGDPELIKSYMAKLLSSASAAAAAAAAEAKVAEATTTDASSELDSYDAACSPARSKPPSSSAPHGGGKVAPTDEKDLDAQPEAV